MQIKLQLRTVYGVDRIYPICDKALLFASLAGKKTFDERDVKIIKALGVVVELIPYEGRKQ